MSSKQGGKAKPLKQPKADKKEYDEDKFSVMSERYREAFKWLKRVVIKYPMLHLPGIKLLMVHKDVMVMLYVNGVCTPEWSCSLWECKADDMDYGEVLCCTMRIRNNLYFLCPTSFAV